MPQKRTERLAMKKENRKTHKQLSRISLRSIYKAQQIWRPKKELSLKNTSQRGLESSLIHTKLLALTRMPMSKKSKKLIEPMPWNTTPKMIQLLRVSKSSKIFPKPTTCSSSRSKRIKIQKKPQIKVCSKISIDRWRISIKLRLRKNQNRIKRMWKHKKRFLTKPMVLKSSKNQKRAKLWQNNKKNRLIRSWKEPSCTQNRATLS